MASAHVERYDDRIAGVLSCYDRVVVTGTLPTVCYAEGMTRFLYANQIRIFDYPEFAVTLRERVREAGLPGNTALLLRTGFVLLGAAGRLLPDVTAQLAGEFTAANLAAPLVAPIVRARTTSRKPGAKRSI